MLCIFRRIVSMFRRTCLYQCRYVLECSLRMLVHWNSLARASAVQSPFAFTSKKKNAINRTTAMRPRNSQSKNVNL